jgi:KUP system potassium uptake protein
MYVGRALDKPPAAIRLTDMAAPVTRPCRSATGGTSAQTERSQAVISGAFSMTSQAIELDFLPCLRVIKTSHEQRGQVYVPAVNAILFAAVMFLVITFRSSARLTSAYGIAVGLTMLITTIQMIALSRTAWNWPKLAVAAVSVPLLSLVPAAKIDSGAVAQIWTCGPKRISSFR